MICYKLRYQTLSNIYHIRKYEIEQKITCNNYKKFVKLSITLLLLEVSNKLVGYVLSCIITK